MADVEKQEENLPSFDIDKYLFVNPEQIKTGVMQWLAHRQAQKRYSKPIDVILKHSTGVYAYKSSKIIHDLITNQEMNSEIFYETERLLSYDENSPDGTAHVVWTIDADSSEPIIGLTTNVWSVKRFKGKAIEVSIQLEVIKSENDAYYYVVETRSKEAITVGLYNEERVEIPLTEFDNLPAEVIEQIKEMKFGETTWEGNFEPFVYLKNNPSGTNDRSLVEGELDEIVLLTQKKRDDILYSSVKVVTSGLKNNNKEKKGNNANFTALANAKKMAASSIVQRDSTALEGNANSVIVNAIPNTDYYDRAIRTVLNTILKKTGGATDVDSKGTVQQSKGEILMSQGDEYKVSNWKKTNRQMKLKELFEKVKSTYTQVIKNTKSFADIDSMFVFISQEEVLSEREQLENAKLAMELGMTNSLLIQARYHNMTILEMFEFQNLSFEGVDDGKKS